MRKLPVMPQDNSAAKQELRRRIALSNRSRLNVGREKLDAVASRLARNNADRVQFVDNPNSYLQQHALPVASWNFTTAANKTVAQTSEVCVVSSCLNVVSRFTSEICVVTDCAITSVWVAAAKVGGLLIGVDLEDQAFAQSNPGVLDRDEVL
jgi:hypothetical protein